MCTTDYTFPVARPSSGSRLSSGVTESKQNHNVSVSAEVRMQWGVQVPTAVRPRFATRPLSRSSCDIQQTTQHRLQQRKYYNNNSSAQQWRKKWPSESRVNDEVYDKTWCCVSLLWPLRLLPRHRAKTLLNYSFVRAAKGQNTNIILAIK